MSEKSEVPGPESEPEPETIPEAEPEPSFLSRHGRKFLILPFLAVGVLGFRALVGSAEEPALRPPGDRGVSVRVVKAARMDVIPRAVGYGTVRPHRTWNAVSQVGGRVVEMLQRLRAGAFVREGELLFAVDPTQYEIEVRRAQAEVARLGAQIRELEMEGRQIEAKQTLQKDLLGLAKRELERLDQLASSGAVTQSQRDAQRRVVLDYENQMLGLQQAADLLPTRREALTSQRAAAQAQRDRAKLDLARCRITAPFDGRIASLDAEQEQVVSVGQTLCAIDGIGRAEVAAPFGFARLRQLREGGGPVEFADLATDEGFRKAFRLDVTVRLRGQALTVEWPAELLRIEAIRAETRTVPFVVGVDDPYRGTSPGKTPPLVKGMYVEVELRGRPLPGRLVVPRSALRQDGTLAVATDDAGLRFVPVEIEFTQGLLAVVASGLEPGALVVLSDVIPAVEGMRLLPTEDLEVTGRLRAAAAGEGAVR